MANSQQATRTAHWPEQGQWTYADWLELPSDGTKYEILGGNLHMTPAPSIAHQAASSELLLTMKLHARQQQLGYVLAAPTDVRLPSEPVPVQPDLLFIARGREDMIGENRIEGAPDLVVEIVSPGNWPYDRNEKYRLYQLNGVREYWLVDYRARTIEVFVLDAGEYALLGKWGDGEKARSQVLAGLQVDVGEVFRGVP